MPIMPMAKGVVTTIIEAEIRAAIFDALEEAAKIADRHVEIHRSSMVKPGQDDWFYLVENAAYDVANEIADAIRTLKDVGE